MTHPYHAQAYPSRHNINLKNFNPKRLWFTSDQHFCHKNVCRLCNRPWFDVESMNKALIRNWNDLVHPTDHVMFLGDLAISNSNDAASCARQLNGIKYWLWGNHDTKQIINYCSEYFEWSGDYLEIEAGGQQIVLSHYPFESWNRRNYGSWMIHGHVHSKLKSDQSKFRLYVGVDNIPGYKPISFDEIKVIMEKKAAGKDDPVYYR